MTDMADAEAAPHERLSERARFTVVMIVASFLKPAELVKLAAGTFETRGFPMGSGEAEYKKSPISRAVDLITGDDTLLSCLHLPPKPSEEATKVAVKNACAYWFWEFAASPLRSSFADQPRRTKADWNLDDADFRSLGHLLTTVQWQDEQGNGRFFASLERMVRDGLDVELDGDRTHEELKEARSRVAELQRIKQRATGRAHENLDTLLLRVQQKCRCETSVRKCGGLQVPCSHPPNA